MPGEPGPRTEIRRVPVDALIDLRWRVLVPGRARSDAHMPRDHAPTSRHWAALRDDRVVGGVSVMALRGWVLRGMAVDPDVQRVGIGRALLGQVHSEVAEPMWCNARLTAVAFYAAMGWTRVGPVFEIVGEGLHQRMLWSP